MVESHVLGLENLIKLGHDVYNIKIQSNAETEILDGIKITRLPQWINMANTPLVTSIRQFVRRTHADIVHVIHPPFTERFAAKGAKEAGKPFVVTHHCDLELKGVLGNTAVSFYQNF